MESRTLLSGGPLPPGGQGVPTAHDDVIDTDEGNPVTIPVLSNDSDPSEINPASVTVVSAPGHGKIVAIDSGTGAITYSPGPLFFGTDSFTYTFKDAFGSTSNAATVTVIVNRPTANDDFAQTVAGQPVTIDVVGNDSDPDGNDHLNPGSVAIVTAPTHGTDSISPTDGSILYTPSAGFEGTERLQYTIMDKAGATSNVATVTITVAAPPAQAGTVINDDSIDTDEGNAVNVPVLANDVSPVGFNPSTVALASQPAHGTATVDPSDGSINYNPAVGFFGTDTFSYTVKDKSGGIAGPGQVSVVVNRPTANDDFTETFGTTPIVIAATANDTDPDGPNKLDVTTLAVATPPLHGVAIPATDGSFTYTAAPGFSGTDHFQYTVKDHAGATSNPATVTVVVDLGQVSGVVFADYNANGVQNAGEPGTPGQVVYLDLNGDGRLDAGDPTDTTDADGRYTFENLPAGSYAVRSELGGATNVVSTAPTTPAQPVTVSPTTQLPAGPSFGVLTFTPLSSVTIAANPFPQGVKDPATAYVLGASRNLSGTTADATASPKAVARLDKSSSQEVRTAVAKSIWESPAHRASEVRADVQAILGRAPSAAEMKSLTKKLKGKNGDEAVVASLLASPEFRAKHSGSTSYVAAVYNQVLGRAPTASESSALTSKLDAKKLTPTKAATEVLASSEAAGLVIDSLYVALLQHPADATTRETLVTRLTRGRASVESLGVGILASDEYYARAAAAAKQG